jgi:hypothetical protein
MIEPGQGSYWTVNLDAPPGTKRPRKRGRRPPPDPNTTSKRGRPRAAYGSIFVEAKYPPPLPHVKTEPDELCDDPMSDGNAQAPARPRWWPTHPPPRSPSPPTHRHLATVPSPSDTAIDHTLVALPPLAPLRALREDDYYSSDAWESENDTSSTGNPSTSPWTHAPDTTSTVTDSVQRIRSSPYERDAPRRPAGFVQDASIVTSVSPEQHGVTLKWKEPIESPLKRPRMESDAGGGRLAEMETGDLTSCPSPLPPSPSFLVRFANDIPNGDAPQRKKPERKAQALRWRIVDYTNRTHASNPPSDG